MRKRRKKKEKREKAQIKKLQSLKMTIKNSGEVNTMVKMVKDHIEERLGRQMTDAEINQFNSMFFNNIS